MSTTTLKRNPTTDLNLTARTPKSKVCLHRSPQIGYVDCGCSGHPKAYRCDKFIRPNKSPAEQAFCVPYLPAKRLKIVGMDKRTVIDEITLDELLECSRCEAFETTEPPPPPGVGSLLRVGKPSG